MKSVLIVEDNEGEQLLSEMLINDFDPQIQTFQAFDGQEALEMLADFSEQPDVIFLDINMPGMDGHEFLEEYSKTPNSLSGVVVILTSSDQKEDKGKTKVYKCVKEYFIKPLDTKNIEDASKAFAKHGKI